MVEERGSRKISVVKVEVLDKDNYDTWCIHAKAYLIKND